MFVVKFGGKKATLERFVARVLVPLVTSTQLWQESELLLPQTFSLS
jgi:hypothetical protein